jgi:RNA polymerase sigma-70 factor (ECF subfamily)
VSEERFLGLLAAAKDGDEDAWKALFDGLAPVVLGYLRTNGAPDADDVLGETFLQVARDIATFEGDEPGFRSWVFTIAHHRLIDARRHSARRPVELSPEPPEPEEPADDAAHEALARIGTARVRTILAELSDDQRAVLLLRFVADLSVEDVARAVGKRPGAVKALQRRGLAAVKRLLTRRGVSL